MSEVNYSIETNYPLATDSPDHIDPFGVKYNNTHNQAFNNKLYELLPRPFRIMDWGCAGGASIKAFIEQGCYGLGIDGSDYRRVHNMEEWNNIPNNLFTCDLSKSFQVLENGTPAKFDVITAWELMEHFHRDDLPQVYESVKRHLKDNGYWIMSICVFDEVKSKDTYGIEWGPKDKFDSKFHHQWCVPREWWYEDFEKNGFKINNEKLAHFEGHFVRGPGIMCPVEYTINVFLELK